MRYSSTVRFGPLLRALALAIFVATLALWWTGMVSTSWAQPPRPTLTPSPSPTSTPGPGPAQAEGQGYFGPNLKGQVINLVTGEPEGSVTVVFATGGISVEAITNKDGEYAFELGAANGVLNAVPPSGSGLKPATTDVAVRTKIGVVTVVNLGVSPNGSGAPPLIPSVRVSPDSVRTGGTITITVTIKNTLSDAISDAIVTDWLPSSLTPVSIHSSTGNPYFSENLAVVELGLLNAGDGALIEIVAQATQGRSVATQLQGRVSLFYRENAAAQARALGGLNGATPAVLPVTGVGLPLIGLLLIVVLVIAGGLRRWLGHARTAQ